LNRLALSNLGHLPRHCIPRSLASACYNSTVKYKGGHHTRFSRPAPGPGRRRSISGPGRHHDPLVITFTEQIGPLTLDLALEPEVAGLHASWNEAGTVATVIHAGFAPGTEYDATVMASDASANPMEAPNHWPFTTQQGWDIYLPLTFR
jgi:hypothetical protein